VTRWACALIIVLGAACGGSQGLHGERVRVIATASSGKKVTIYASPAYRDTEQRPVPEDVVVQAMHASGTFFEEDIRALSADITKALASLEVGQRVVIETSDTQVHVYVANGELQIAGYRDDQEVSRHTSAIPAAAVQTRLTPRPMATDPTTTVIAPSSPTRPAPPAPVVTPPAQIVATPPPATGTATAAPPSSTGSDATIQVHLGEAEVRKRLNELDRLLAKHLITQAEYDQKRKALLDQM
jgi:hypothetical protein